MILKKLRDYLDLHLPKKTFNFILFIYLWLFVDPKYLFKNPGYFKKVTADAESLLNIRVIKFLKFKRYKFYNHGSGMVLDIFSSEIYKPLLTCKKILNLGGFVGESAIYLSQKCQKVYSFEPERDKFGWMKKNISLNHLEEKIFPYDYAVLNSNKKYIYIKKSNKFDSSASVTQYNDYYANYRDKVKCMHIKKVLNLDKFDGLQCDVEGAEWGILEYFIKNKKKWNFNKSIIELHFSYINFNKEMKILNDFLRLLKSKRYKHHFFRFLSDIPKKRI
jgi:FkbM family methyltransferase